jgi:hypothetical protein
MVCDKVSPFLINLSYLKVSGVQKQVLPEGHVPLLGPWVLQGKLHLEISNHNKYKTSRISSNDS